METKEHLVFFGPKKYSSAFKDTIRILTRNDLNVLESDFERGVIRASIDSDDVDNIQVIAKFWKGEEKILIGIRGSISLDSKGARHIGKMLKKLHGDLRKLDYAY